MGLRFRKSIKIAPGVKANFSKGGVSTSLGKAGATVNIGKKGARATVGVPGTGLSYSRKIGGKSADNVEDYAGEPLWWTIMKVAGKLLIGVMLVFAAIMTMIGALASSGSRRR